MRSTPGVILFAAAIGVLFTGRYHLLDLARALETYTRFYAYLSQHPETRFIYSAIRDEQAPRGESLSVPRIMHRIQLGDDAHIRRLEHHTSPVNSCQYLHPNWTHYTWTDVDAAAFMHDHYPHIWPQYQGYSQTVQRANILRYALLNHFGGVYLDRDIDCLKPLDSLLHLPWLAPAAYPAGLSNGFMLSRKEHPFLKQLLDGVIESDLSWALPYVDTMLSTGCMFLSGRWMSYVRSLSRMAAAIPEADQVYVLADKHGNVKSHMLRGAVTTPLFRHGGASSWHKWDAGIILFIGNHFGYLLVVMVLGAAFAVVMIWIISVRSQHSMKKLRRYYPRNAMLAKSIAGQGCDV